MSEILYKSLELFVYIVNYNEGSRVMKIARQSSVAGATAFLGHGTMESTLLDFIGLNDIRKELVIMAAETEPGYEAMKRIKRSLKLEKPGRGIAFTLGITRLIGTGTDCRTDPKMNRGEKNMYEAIFVVVDKGKGRSVIDAAKKAGSQGATLINARGSGTEESRLFTLDIEPQKEIILILSENTHADKIIDAISLETQIEQPGNGILFTCDVTRTLGLYNRKG